MEILGQPVRFLPEGLPLARKADLAFPLPAGESHPERAGVYRLDESDGSWGYAGGEAGEKGITLALGRLATFALMRDDSPPRILGVEPSGPGSRAPRLPTFRVRAEDRGEGLDYDGVHLALDGVEIEMEFDPDRGWSTGIPAAPLSPGRHAGTAWAMDRAGNRSATLAFDVRVP